MLIDIAVSTVCVCVCLRPRQRVYQIYFPSCVRERQYKCEKPCRALRVWNILSSEWPETVNDLRAPKTVWSAHF